ncbi:hypothetical protein, partial [Staphylococcus simulans]|uniref:hypothetical protein n=2 Tax=Staphylococcus TaxID=1279 RepID=UPI000D4F1243
MSKESIIKRLFSLQNEETMLKIINDLSLDIRGFSKVNINIIKQQKSFIISNISYSNNLKKIDRYVKEVSKIKDYNFDYLLESEKIVEKYGEDFRDLIMLFSEDGYQQKSIEVLELLENKHDNLNSGRKEILSNENNSEIVNIRKIVKELESQLEIKNKKIQDLQEKNQKLQREIQRKEEKIKNESVKIKKIELEFNNLKKFEIENKRLYEENKHINQLLQKKSEESRGIVEENKKLSDEIYNLKNVSKTRMIVIGLPELYKNRVKSNIVYY